MKTLLTKYGVVHKPATPYHTQTKGQVDVFNRQIIKYFGDNCKYNKVMLEWALEWWFMGLHDNL